MKLLFDQNIAAQLTVGLADIFPGSEHVRLIGLQEASDLEIWDYAKAHGLALVSKDSDFFHRSMLVGHPPKIVVVRLGNCSTNAIADLIRARYLDLLKFERDDTASFYVLP